MQTLIEPRSSLVRVMPLIVIGLFGLMSCSGGQEATMMAQRLDSLDNRLDSLAAYQKTMASWVSKVYWDQLESDRATINLEPTSKGYSRIDTDNGFFLVSLKDITPYLNGYKVTLNIGNPLFATFHGMTFKVSWGHPKDSIQSYEGWRASLQTKEIPSVDEIKPGSWNAVELLLVPAAPEQLGYISLAIATDNVSLLK